MQFWENIKRIFAGDSDEDQTPVPLTHEVIQRSAAEQQSYLLWKADKECQNMLLWIDTEFKRYCNSESLDRKIDFLDIACAKGFVIHFDETIWDKRDFICLLDYLKEKVLDLGYKVQVSDVRVFRKGKSIESVQRHFLKPPSSYVAGEKHNQRYGNIMICVSEHGNTLINLKFSATHYMDRQYEKAESFDLLMNQVLRAQE